MEPEQYISMIRQGDEEAREQFIAEYYPYIAKVASGFCKRYVDPERDDEFSVALLAFNEAIDRYDSLAGASFLGFSATVIRRRLIDHVRKEERHLRTVPYSSFDTEKDEGTFNILELSEAMAVHEDNRIMEERRYEIIELGKELRNYGIAFAELPEQSPKHADSRELLIGIARLLASDAGLMKLLKEKRRLPIKELMEAGGVSRKTIERNRKYLITIALVLSGSYPYMNDYLKISDQHAERKEASK
ncbi:RNA polymerase sigma factor SigI [Paenibacillus chungangensis]|uniref:RNA polymerase sigma factor SigI n=1 Tax=Paenibacillus chungangensis TaxID=696535 RepID=A0ABW3HUV4_9BACL